MNTNKKILKTVVVGFGKLGLLHLSQFSAHPNVRVIGICENEKIMNKLLSKNFNGLKIFNDYKSLLNLELDFITVCTPTGSHFKIIKFFF